MSKITKEEAVEKMNRTKYAPTVHITKGNGKTGIWSVSLLAGNDSHGYDGTIPAVYKELAAECRGTCGCDCPGCYAKGSTRYPDYFLNLVENTYLARKNPAEFWRAVEKEVFGGVMIPAVFRIHDSGEFFSVEYMRECFAFVARHPETRFGAFTKRADLLEAVGLENIPANFTLSCSPWPGYCEPIGDLPQFCYDDGSNPEIAGLHHCPAVDKDGHRTGVQCAQCQHCYRAKRGERWAVYAH